MTFKAGRQPARVATTSATDSVGFLRNSTSKLFISEQKKRSLFEASEGYPQVCAVSREKAARRVVRATRSSGGKLHPRNLEGTEEAAEIRLHPASYSSRISR